MKKFFFYAMMAVSAFAFTACGDDDDPVTPPSGQNQNGNNQNNNNNNNTGNGNSEQVLNNLAANQMSFMGVGKYDVVCDLGISAGYEGVPSRSFAGMNYIDSITGRIINMHVDMNTDEIGKTIDLTNPKAALGEKGDFALMLGAYSENDENEEDINKLFDANIRMTYHDGQAFTYGYYFVLGHTLMPNPDQERTMEIFKEGKFTSSLDNNGFTFSLNATLVTGEVIAAKGFVKKSDIMYW